MTRRGALLALTSAAVLTSFALGLPARAQAEPSLRPLDPGSLQHEIADRKGKVVVVNLWATWCGPCVEEFPDLVRAYQADKAKRLDLITISFDDAPDVPKKVVPFLAKRGLSTGTFVNKAGSTIDEKYIRFLEPKLPADEAFALPRTYIFDRNGKLVTVLTGGQTFASFQKAVAKALAL